MRITLVFVSRVPCPQIRTSSTVAVFVASRTSEFCDAIFGSLITSPTGWLAIAGWFHPDPETIKLFLEDLSPDIDAP